MNLFKDDPAFKSIDNLYYKMLLVGTGSYGEVHKVVLKDGMDIYALKQSRFPGVADYKVDRNNRDLKRWKQAIAEIRIMSIMRHPNVVMYRDSFYD